MEDEVEAESSIVGPLDSVAEAALTGPLDSTTSDVGVSPAHLSCHFGYITK
jgi:hypothetical protein